MSLSLGIMLLLTGAGVYLTVGSRFVQIRRFGEMFRVTLGSLFTRSERRGQRQGQVTPFMALSTALASTMGTGNIAGVATALTMGGPGAIFWMWVSALLGMATKFGEVALAVKYRERDTEGGFHGGPMYYIQKGLKSVPLAVLFAVAGLLAALGTGNLVQVHSMAEGLWSAFGWPKIITGVLCALLSALVITGGLKSIAGVSSKMVPLMFFLYTGAAVCILVLCREKIPEVFALILRSAFRGEAVAGGASGATVTAAIRYGVARGVFSNEAGMGSAPIAHASAQTDSPARQGLWGALEVFLDTIVMCTLTALVILVSGAYQTGTGVQSAGLTGRAFETVLGMPGRVIVAVSLMLFAFTSIIGWAYYGRACLAYLCRSPLLDRVYTALYLGGVAVGAVLDMSFVWRLTDALVALMCVPNMIALMGLSSQIFTLADQPTKRNVT